MQELVYFPTLTVRSLIQIPRRQRAGNQQGVPAISGRGRPHTGDPLAGHRGQREEGGSGCGLHGGSPPRAGHHHHPVLHPRHPHRHGHLQTVSPLSPRTDNHRFRDRFVIFNRLSGSYEENIFQLSGPLLREMLCYAGFSPL